MKIAIIRERKNPPDRRAALTPEQCASLSKKYPNVEVVVESSPDRIFTDQDYRDHGIEVVGNVNDCDVLLGIKEVPTDFLIPNKTYTFFSHTIKKQKQNQQMLQNILQKNIRLVDYECLVWPENDAQKRSGRILGFGHWAGVIGTYNAFLTFGKKYALFNLKPAYQCADYQEIKENLSKILDKIPAINIGVTGSGRVTGGILEVLRYLKIKEVDSETYLNQKFEEIVFTHLSNHHIYRRKDNQNAPWNVKHFYKNHGEYEGTFMRFASCTDMLINGLYWEPTLPRLFEKTDTNRPDFRIKVIADISCDIDGSVPITIKATYPDNPTFGWNPKTQSEAPPFSENVIDVMAVSVLPSEIPADASKDFGQVLSDSIIPLFINGDEHRILQNATIAENGQLTADFLYLEDYAKGV